MEHAIQNKAVLDARKRYEAFTGEVNSAKPMRRARSGSMT